MTIWSLNLSVLVFVNPGQVDEARECLIAFPCALTVSFLPHVMFILYPKISLSSPLKNETPRKSLSVRWCCNTRLTIIQSIFYHLNTEVGNALYLDDFSVQVSGICIPTLFLLKFVFCAEVCF